MNNFENFWWLHFIPECYFDTLLVRKLLQTNKRLVHRKGCTNVVADLNSKRLMDSFAVAIVDKDKTELDYLKSCHLYYDANKIKLWKHKERQQFVIQLNPPLEKWVMEILTENGMAIEEFGYDSDYKRLKKQIKQDIDSETDEKLNKLVNAIIKTDCAPIKKLKSFLQHLRDKNYQADINILLNA
jgi:hypothetical protein